MSRSFRRIYVELVGLTAVTLLAIGAWRLVAESERGWLIAAGTWLIAALSIGLSKVRISRRPARDDWAWRVGGAVLSAGALTAGGLVPFAVAVGGIVALVGYQTAYVAQHRPDGPLAVGQVLPEFPLVRTDGTAASSAEFRGNPHFLLFYRGTWCPFCVAQVQALADGYRELERRGVRVALISPQVAEDTRALSRRFEAPMGFYVDENGAAARLLDIVQAGGVPLALGAGTNGDTVVPTVVITDGEGRVIWLQHAEDHRVRPEPTTFLEVIDSAGVGKR